MKKIYLDYAAATPIDPKVLEAMHPYFSDKFHNPSAIYLAAQEARQALEKSRGDIAKWLGAKSTEVVFTAGTTEANNLAIAGIMRRYPEAEILTSAIEHDSVLEPAKQFNHRLIPVQQDGIVDLAQLAKLITDKTVLISVMYVNNELGTIQPLSKIAKLVKTVREKRLETANKLPIYIHSDAAQAGNFFDLHITGLGVDMMSLNGGKIYGPKQTGILYTKAGIELQPLILGGGQENGLRSGTENLPGAIGLAAALDMAQTQRHQESKRIKDLQKLFIKELSIKIPKAIINGSAKHRAPHLISATLPSIDNERLIMELDETGIQAAAGSACSASDEPASHVLKAIGLSDGAASSTLRFSFGRQTTATDIHRTINSLQSLTKSAINR